MRRRIITAILIFLWAGGVLWFSPMKIWSSFLFTAWVWVLFFPSKQEIGAYTYEHLAFSPLQEAVSRNEVSLLKALALVTRVRLFPFFLIVYLVYLFVSETHLWNLQYTRLFLSTDEYLLLVFVLATWIFSLRGEDETTKAYIMNKTSPVYGVVYLFLSVVFAGVGIWVVGAQTLSLWRIVHLLSSSTWVLISLLSFVLFQYRE